MIPRNQSNGAGVMVPVSGMIPMDWLCKRGFNRARETHALEPRDDDIRSLTELAKTTAAYVARAEFNPATVPEDRIRDALFNRTEASANRLDEELRISGKRCGEAADSAARKRAQVGAEPERPTVAMVTAVGVLAVSVAPTLHDFVFHTFRDEILNWFLSLGISALLGVMLAWGFFFRSVARSRTPLIVGTVISLGLAALRLSAAENLQEVIFAIGLVLLEVGVVVFLDWRAGLHNKDVAECVERGIGAQEAEAASSAQRSEYERLLSERKKLDEKIQEHVSYMEHRVELARDNSAREQVYIGVVCDSYLQGIAENCGRLRPFE